MDKNHMFYNDFMEDEYQQEVANIYVNKPVGNIPSAENYDFYKIPNNTKLSGVSFENRQDIIPKLFEGVEVKLVRDPKNKFDRYAIRAYIKYDNKPLQIGWIPKDLAFQLSQEIDAGIKWNGKIEKVIGGEDQTKGIVIALQYK